jgi:hypothetical protein
VLLISAYSHDMVRHGQQPIHVKLSQTYTTSFREYEYCDGLELELIPGKKGAMLSSLGGT